MKKQTTVIIILATALVVYFLCSFLLKRETDEGLQGKTDGKLPVPESFDELMEDFLNDRWTSKIKEYQEFLLVKDDDLKNYSFRVNFGNPQYTSNNTKKTTSQIFRVSNTIGLDETSKWSITIEDYSGTELLSTLIYKSGGDGVGVFFANYADEKPIEMITSYTIGGFLAGGVNRPNNLVSAFISRSKPRKKAREMFQEYYKEMGFDKLEEENNNENENDTIKSE